DQGAPPRDHPPDAAPATPHLDGSWPLHRALVSAVPVPPRTAACTEPYTTGNQPSLMTIVGTLVGTDYGTPPEHLSLGGPHYLSFDLSESWTTVGWTQPHPLHYDFDRTAADTLTGTVTSAPNWPSGACNYTFVILSKRMTGLEL